MEKKKRSKEKLRSLSEALGRPALPRTLQTHPQE